MRTVRPGHRRAFRSSSPRRASSGGPWWSGSSRTATRRFRPRLLHPTPSAAPQPDRLSRPLFGRRGGAVRRVRDARRRGSHPSAGRPSPWPRPRWARPATSGSVGRCGRPTTGRSVRWTTDWLRSSSTSTHRGLAESTLVVLTSDHGEMGGDHWLLEKLGFWDESYHVPLIVVDPRAEAEGSRGTIVDAVTESVDVLPTICDFIGVEAPLQADGWSLGPFLRDEPTPRTGATRRTSNGASRTRSISWPNRRFGIPMSHCSLAVSARATVQVRPVRGRRRPDATLALRPRAAIRSSDTTFCSRSRSGSGVGRVGGHRRNCCSGRCARRSARSAAPSSTPSGASSKLVTRGAEERGRLLPCGMLTPARDEEAARGA